MSDEEESQKAKLAHRRGNGIKASMQGIEASGSTGLLGMLILAFAGVAAASVWVNYHNGKTVRAENAYQHRRLELSNERVACSILISALTRRADALQDYKAVKEALDTLQRPADFALHCHWMKQMPTKEEFQFSDP